MELYVFLNFSQLFHFLKYKTQNCFKQKSVQLTITLLKPNKNLQKWQVEDPLKNTQKGKKQVTVRRQTQEFPPSRFTQVKCNPHNEMQHWLRKQKQSFVYHNL